MIVTRTLLALGMVAAVVLVGCKQPVGMPNRNTHAASTVVDTCFVATDTALSGHVDWYQTGLMSEYYTRSIPLIKRGYVDSAGLQHPRMNGFCTFEVPYFDPGGNIPECTLHYYQSAHNGSADLRVNHASSIEYWPGVTDGTLFWATWNDEPIIATDAAQSRDGWHTVLLTEEGCGAVLERAGSFLLTGWTYRGNVSGTYADVIGTGANAPFIVFVYDASK